MSIADKIASMVGTETPKTRAAAFRAAAETPGAVTSDLYDTYLLLDHARQACERCDAIAADPATDNPSGVLHPDGRPYSVAAQTRADWGSQLGREVVAMVAKAETKGARNAAFRANSFIPMERIPAELGRELETYRTKLFACEDAELAPDAERLLADMGPATYPHIAAVADEMTARGMSAAADSVRGKMRAHQRSYFQDADYLAGRDLRKRAQEFLAALPNNNPDPTLTVECDGKVFEVRASELVEG